VPDHNSPRLKVTLSDLIRELDVFGNPVVMSVSRPSVMVKRIRLSGVKPNSLDEYLTWEDHRYIPCAMQDMYFDHWKLIREMVKQEDVRKPLKDQEIVSKLRIRGMIIARRTVARYRTGLRIPSASQRKRMQ